MEQFVIQNAIDWNIKMRDSNRHAAMVKQHDIPSAREHSRNARRFQRNVDHLNDALTHVQKQPSDRERKR